MDRKFNEDDGESTKQTRRKRFLDPESGFGKKSLVYQLKHGALKEKGDSLPLQEFVRPRTFGRPRMDQQTPMGARSGRTEYPRSRQPPSRDGSFSRGGGMRGSRRSDRGGARDSDRVGFTSDRGQRQTRRYDKEDDAPHRTPRSELRPSFIDLRQSQIPDRFNAGNRDRFGRDSERGLRRDGGREPRRDDDWEPRRDGERGSRRDDEWEPRRDNERDSRRESEWDSKRDVRAQDKMKPTTINYTTAASQFLYGRSVVKAALEQGRRKLYNLYVQQGEHRADSKEQAAVTKLAQQQRIPITFVPAGEQRMMDKMSMGRPHNGFVLETSPLPQLPVKSLGKVEETPGKLGFHIERDYQTKEEETVNGNMTFIPRAGAVATKPFVLLLNEILDPGNLGGLLRTASYLGIDAVAITNRSSSTLTPVVLKSAAGAVEEITIFAVDSPVKFIEDSKAAGWKTYAAVAPPDRKLSRMHSSKFVSVDMIEQNQPLSNDPCILVLGNEGYGLSKQMKMVADYEVSVPRFVKESCVDSLNVSVAAGLLCHSFVRSNTATSTQQDGGDGFDEMYQNRKDTGSGVGGKGAIGEELMF